jgi:hypothetical protein
MKNTDRAAVTGERIPAPEFKKGDLLQIKAHRSDKGKGLSYPNMLVIASEDGHNEGWDVYDGTWHGAEVSFYGFSVMGEGTVSRVYSGYNNGETIIEEIDVLPVSNDYMEQVTGLQERNAKTHPKNTKKK